MGWKKIQTGTSEGAHDPNSISPESIQGVYPYRFNLCNPDWKYVEIKPSTKYWGDYYTDFSFYDANMVFIQKLRPPVSTNDNFIISPTNAKYMSWNYTGAPPTPTTGPYLTDGLYTTKRRDKDHYFFQFKDEQMKKDFFHHLNTNSLAGKKWGSIGDSVSAPSKYQNYVVTETGLTLSLKAVSGAWISKPAPIGSMIDFVDELPTELDYVTVMGGVNDASNSVPIGAFSSNLDTTTFHGALHVLCQKLITKYPAARIGLITNTQNGAGSDQYLPYAEAIEKVGAYYSIPVLNLFTRGGLTSRAGSTVWNMYFTDGIHPKDEGHKMIARKVQRFLESL
jgi:hypothetical protein